MTSLTYRTTDLTKWGTGKGSPLTSSEGDTNIYYLYSLITAVMDHAGSNAGIANITESGGSLYVTLTDSTILGPFPIPTALWTYRGAWTSGTSYAVNDVFTSGGLYLVLVAHVSSAPFDPNATDGLGHNLYGLLLPSMGAPVQTHSGSYWTPTLQDAFTYNRFTHPSLSEMIIPLDTITDFAIDTEIYGRQASIGHVLIVAHSGVTLNLQDSCLNLTNGEGSTFTVKKVAADEWDLWGRLMPSSP